ncbi:unnamed protein product [Prunus armeniaca]|uniref:Uncharacterized protein n=1 Tax=Prunus armeniaca TaxID=36596 RepID=A0A6J5XP62_PRUAR|nr:unnamed protein product [Prunus armeniaca]
MWVWGKSLGSLGDEEVRWEERRVHLEGEKLTMAVILGGKSKGRGAGVMGSWGPGVEGSCWMGLGGEWLWDGFGGWSSHGGERERES